MSWGELVVELHLASLVGPPAPGRLEAGATKACVTQAGKKATGLVGGVGVLGPELQSDLDALAEAGIPVDVVFEQGLDVLGL